jgi:hypothetical protein
MKTFQEFIDESRRLTAKMKRERNAARKPSKDETIENERGEFERYPNSSEMMQKARTAPIRKLGSQEVSQLSNTDAGEIKSGAKGRRRVRQLAKEYGRDVNRVRNQIKQGVNEPSIVHKGELVAGNTRAMVLRSLGRKVPVIDVPD